MKEKYVSVKELARYLGVSQNMVYLLAKRKMFRVYKLGRLLKFKTSEVDERMSKLRVNPEE